jgi:phosphatidylglycerol:prolipoprotein diacylglycerol transferase
LNPQLHTAFSGLAIFVLGIGAYLRLHRHPLYTHRLLLDGLFYVVWAGLVVAWLPNLIPPLKALLAGEPPPSGWWQAGLDHWMLGLAGGLAAVYVYAHTHKLPLLVILDAIAPVLALTLVVWRVGCAVNADAYGKVTSSSSWAAMWLPDVYGVYAWRYPTQYASIITNLIIAVLLVGIERIATGRLVPGVLFCFYIILYAVQRFVLEFWRGDKLSIAGPFTVTHFFCVIAVAFTFWGLWRLRQLARPGLDQIAGSGEPHIVE